MDMLKKILSIVIIILFIGIGTQPAFAVDTNTSVVNQQSEEVCECQVVNRSNRVSSFICDILESILNYVGEMFLHYYNNSIDAGNSILGIFYLGLCFFYFRIWNKIWIIGNDIGCWGP